ncbi:hypothetical protein NMY22_g7114 [Coprinellus aureogranulatus]|nr:hypothetical protein NMY22_g7114 [Coprinellus aureogranulatus]
MGRTVRRLTNVDGEDRSRLDEGGWKRGWGGGKTGVCWIVVDPFARGRRRKGIRQRALRSSSRGSPCTAKTIDEADTDTIPLYEIPRLLPPLDPIGRPRPSTHTASHPVPPTTPSYIRTQISRYLSLCAGSPSSSFFLPPCDMRAERAGRDPEVEI